MRPCRGKAGLAGKSSAPLCQRGAAGIMRELRERWCYPRQPLQRGKMMPRPRQRACLQSGLRLNLNRLIRRGIVEPGAYSGREVSWTDSYDDEQIASGLITADMSGPDPQKRTLAGVV